MEDKETQFRFKINSTLILEQLFNITAKNRLILLKYLENTPAEALYKIPAQFNNNIWWNIAHVAVTQQKLVYGLSGLPLNMSDELVEKYQKGSFPQGTPSTAEVALIKDLLISLPQKTEEDYNKGVFTTYTSYMTTPKVALNNVEDAISFNIFHEGLHLGSIMALSRAIKM